MTPDRYQQAEALFNAALELEPDEREVYLVEACGSDSELRSEVESLLAAYGQQVSFLEKPPIAAAAGALAKLDAESGRGRVIGHYHILGLLGRGGMGEVYLAEDRRLDRRVALKLLPVLFTNDPDRLRRFIKEAKAASSLNHPNIITIHEIGNEAGSHFIATEFVEGQTLRQQIGSLSLADALEIAIQVASALSAAQTSGIIHRDIKPENIMVRPDGLVKVLDFGIVKLTIESSPSIDTDISNEDRAMTAPGVVIGTLQYMSPEQVRGVEVDARTDIFSLGVVIYEMVVGRAPFDGDTQSDVIAAILTANSEPISEHRTDVSAEFERIISKALQKKREERYQSARELLIDLKNLRQELEIAARLKRTTNEIKLGRTTGEIRPARLSLKLIALRSKRFARAWMILIGAIALGAIIWWVVRRFEPNDTAFLSSLRQSLIYNQKAEMVVTNPDGTISPDGRMLSFSLSKGERRHIWLTLIGEGEPVQITEGEGSDSSPIWSPDGLQIAYVSQKDGEISIWRVPAIGGTPKSIATLPSSAIPVLRRWSKNSPIIYYELDHNLHALDLTSGRTTPLTKFDSSRDFPSDFAISPQENRIAYIDRTDNQIDLWTAPMTGGVPVRLTNDAAEDRRPIWHPDGKRIVYSSDHNGIYQVFVIRVDDHNPLQVTYRESQCLVSDVSVDGSKIVYGGVKEESDIWSVSLENGEEFVVSSDPGVEFWPDLSPDGKSVAFQAIKGVIDGNNLHNSSILIKPLKPDGPQIQLAAGGFDPRWSPDAARVAFLRKSGNEFHLWSLKATGGEERQLTERNINILSNGILPYNRETARPFSWAPDSSRIAYVSSDSGKSGIWLINSEGSNERNLVNSEDTKIAYHSVLWSPSGKQIAFVSSYIGDGTTTWEVWITDLETGKIGKLAQYTHTPILLGWGAARTGLVLAIAEGEVGATSASATINLFRVSITEGRQQLVSRLSPAYLRTPSLQLSPDGRNIGFVSRQNGSDNLWVIPAEGGKARKVTANNDPKLYFSSLAWSPDGKVIYFSKHMRWIMTILLENFKSF